MKGTDGKRVLVVQSQIKQYRLPFYEKLDEALRETGVGLRVAYSDAVGREAAKGDAADLPPELGSKVKAYWLFGRRLLYQPVWREAIASDLVIVEQANKHILNYPLLCLSAMGVQRVAFWGHGRNRQSRQPGFSEWLKERTLNRVDWWFAYTAGTVDYLVQHGVPRSKITNVQNAIDTTAFRHEIAGISEPELASARRQLGVPQDAKVGLFCGGVTREKLPEFLLDSVVKIKDGLPEFHLLAVGSGPEQACFERAASRYPWIHYLGRRFKKEKALYFKLADVFLMPGLVGLAILDAFAAGLPVLTTDIPIHSPEIEYVKAEENGVITSPHVGAYSDATICLLTDASALHDLQAGALASARRYSMEAMVASFRHGILQCLGMIAHASTSQAAATGRVS